MPTDIFHKLAALLGTDASVLCALDEAMIARGFSSGVPERLCSENDARVERSCAALGTNSTALPDIQKLLLQRIREDEEKLIAFLGAVTDSDIFDRAASLARDIVETGTPRLRSGQDGYFLKRDRAVKILTERPPLALLAHLGESSIETVLATHDVTEVMSALRFIEPAEWMHDTFDAVYRGFTAADFEERPIEIKVLGPVWRDVAAAFVAKKHHNVSHLKEFGVIFVNPIAEDSPGSFIRDFSLLLHYFHEIEFYAKLFRNSASRPDFPDRFTSLLRGDVPEATTVGPGEWLIVQRYLVKEDAADPRLSLPRLNPESLHWLRGERDLATYVVPGFPDLSFWGGQDWVANSVSFDLEDTAMSLVSSAAGMGGYFTYHQREAMWTRLFQEYVGGEEKMEELLIKNFDKGVIQF